MPGAYNDEPRNPVIARHEAIHIQAPQPGLLRSARNDGDLYRHLSFLQGIFPMPAARNDKNVISTFSTAGMPLLPYRNDGDTYRHCEERSNPGDNMNNTG